MDEIVVNTGFEFSKEDVLRHGLKMAVKPATEQLMHHIEDKFVALVASQLQDEGNRYQFTLSVKKMEIEEEPISNE